MQCTVLYSVQRNSAEYETNSSLYFAHSFGVGVPADTKTTIIIFVLRDKIYCTRVMIKFIFVETKFSYVENRVKYVLYSISYGDGDKHAIRNVN